MTNITGNSFKDVYKEVLEKLVTNPDYISSPRGAKTHELMDVTLTIENPTLNLFTNSYRGIPISYLRKELALYLSGRNDAEGFINASKFWKNIQTTRGTINSAYGYLIFSPSLEGYMSQFDWAYEKLREDKDTRQAIMFFNNPEFQYSGNKDFVCTLNGLFHIRNNKLNFRINMRSNDIRRGVQYDIPFFMLLQYLMYLLLKDTVYPDLELGTYTHYAASMHLYDAVGDKIDEMDLARNMVEAKWGVDTFPLPQDASVIMNPIVRSISEGDIPEIMEDDPNIEFYKWLMK